MPSQRSVNACCCTKLFSPKSKVRLLLQKRLSSHPFFINTYLAVTICDKSGIFSGKLFLNVPAELRENWDRNDLSLPLVPRLPMLPELSEPFRRSVEGTLPLSEDSTSSVKQIRKYSLNICDYRRESDT